MKQVLIEKHEVSVQKKEDKRQSEASLSSCSLSVSGLVEEP